MNKKNYNIIGVMSGTSLDGVDLVYVKFDANNYQNFTILQSQTVSYSKEWKQLLQNAIFSDDKALKNLDIVYGKYFYYSFTSRYSSAHRNDQWQI